MRTVWGSEFANQKLNRTFSLWASQKIFGSFRGFGPCSTMGVFEDEELIAVMVYHNYDRKSGVIEISGAASNKEWLKRHVLREMFSVPFDNMGCQMVVMRVSPNDKALGRMLTAYGFSSYVIPRLRGRNEDEVIFTLTDTVWMNNKFNRRIGSDSDEHANALTKAA